MVSAPTDECRHVKFRLVGVKMHEDAAEAVAGQAETYTSGSPAR
jgi:hypothetical protein